MSIYLGNLEIGEIEARAKVTFPQELRDYMRDRHQSRASDIEIGKWHCFDIPFILVCGDMETAKDIYKHLSPLSGDFAQPMQIAIAP